MKELVGSCQVCGKDVFCMDGFLNGIHTEDKRLLCFECENNERSESAKNQ